MKDPFLASRAALLLPSSSTIQIEHYGASLAEDYGEKALRESESNPRYHWKGEVSHRQTLEALARCHILINSSKMEGGANAICEALALEVPLLATEVAGNVGLLGKDYPGYFEVGNERELAHLLSRAEEEESFYQNLKKSVSRRSHLVHPQREFAAWQKLLEELF